MSSTLSYTPPALPEAVPGPVRRRHVFYVPGYDPGAGSRYRMLFVRELTRYAKRFAEPKRQISRAVTSPDGLVQSWSVAALPETQGAETSYDVLLWDDLVARDFARWRVISVLLLVAGTLQTIANGLMVRFYRLNWKYGNVILYPFVMVILLCLGASLVGALVQAGLDSSLGWPPWASIPAGILAGLGMVAALEALLNRAFFWQLLNDWVFNWQHGQGWRPDYEARLDRFADHILARLAGFAAEGTRLDEIMVLGHSTGALTAVEVTARVLARDPDLGRAAPNLSLLTLGSGMPLVALQPRAVRVREEIKRLVASPRLVWAEYQAPQDWMNFPGFNPVRHLGLDLEGAPVTNPLLRSAKFREVMTTETYMKVRRRPFRMHFQFLVANEVRGDYDFFAMTLGPQRLRERVLAPVHPTA
ncbi:alpha/beta hydrolase [Methylobacterium iners]|uniref:Alpha/beta hydrolase n=1 Tax=Methylobacterium iners TaxID=418707 RepID=A0ABQ4S2W0_9HYPH|nr:alpha/beta hydrolase [Methylobacterium iners]GJD97216.1 hypothetical protein OCOJLMKI_4444 [Methylobacterium iners]